jgi:hypothetical protein
MREVLAAMALVCVCTGVAHGKEGELAPLGGEDGEPVTADDGDGEGEQAASTVPADRAPGDLGPAGPGHKGQLGVALQFGSGFRGILPYDDMYCGDRGENGSGSANAEYCLGRSPITADINLAYGVSRTAEVFLELRLGLERDFGKDPMLKGPHILAFSPGVKVYFSESGSNKFFSTLQLAIDTTDYEMPDGSDAGTDYSVKNANGIQFDLHRAVGLYLYFAEQVGWSRWLWVGMEAGAGIQSRFP